MQTSANNKMSSVFVYYVILLQLNNQMDHAYKTIIILKIKKIDGYENSEDLVWE